MTLARTASLIAMPAYITSQHLADYLSRQQDYALFLDLDGTLAEFTVDPKASVIPNATLTLLQDIQNCGVPIAVVTGRSLAEAKQMLTPVRLPIAATHGLEIDFNNINTNKNNRLTSTLIDTTELKSIKHQMLQSCLPYDDFLIEDKPYSVALHYRKNPALADTAHAIMAALVKSYSNWTVKPGKFVLELLPTGVDKGSAILTLLENIPHSQSLCPIFIGDDLTDEAGFMAVQGRINFDAQAAEYLSKPARSTGLGIKVGNAPTCAHYYVNSISEVTELLKSFLEFCQHRTAEFTASAPRSATKIAGYAL